MNFGGIQKLSLLDYPDKTCCTLFTLGCNFRCPYCHNSSIIQCKPSGQIITKSEVIEFLRKRKGLLDGVCISGGEPMMQSDLGDFIREIKLLGYLVKLDTNGSYPERLKHFIDNNLVDYVAMDIKNSPDKYGETVGIKNFDINPIKESIAILHSNVVEYEFRTTVVREFHTSEEVLSIAHWIKGEPNYYLQSFVDSGDILEGGLSAYSKEDMEFFQELVRPLIPNVQLRGV